MAKTNSLVPKRANVQDDFTPTTRGRKRDTEFVEAWSAELETLHGEGLSGKIVTYPDVPLNIAAKLRKEFDVDVKMRGIDKETNTGQLEILVP